MKLVIDINKDVRTAISRMGLLRIPDEMQKKVDKAIQHGTPLPKGHGRLIDADRTALLSDLFCYTRYTGIDEAPYEDATKALEFAPTIIEADKAEREG